ncbi:hypothetical protein [Nitrosospira sp. Nsp13]|jgi:hypothetical protein|nr:hypothetical protein [Nitrosospira sp. Nsp13]SCX95565.1 hypothetical protein SAMN05216308_102119 [Nitrosospira sp. Nsp13]
MTLEPAVHCSRVRTLAVGIANESSIAYPSQVLLTVSRTMFSRLEMAIH